MKYFWDRWQAEGREPDDGRRLSRAMDRCSVGHPEPLPISFEADEYVIRERSELIEKSFRDPYKIKKTAFDYIEKERFNQPILNDPHYSLKDQYDFKLTPEQEKMLKNIDWGEINRRYERIRKGQKIKDNG